MVLLQSDLMSATFTLGDVIEILVLIVGLVAGWYKMVNTTRALQDRDDGQEKDYTQLRVQFEKYVDEQKARDKEQDAEMKLVKEAINTFEKKQLEVLNNVNLAMQELRTEIKNERSEIMRLLIEFMNKQKPI